jgi:hypothetical protein
MGKIIEVLHYYMLAIKYVPILLKIKPTKQYTNKIRHHKEDSVVVDISKTHY